MKLLYQVRTAARLAHLGGLQTVAFELDAIAAVLQVRNPRPPSVDGPPPTPSAADWTRLGE